MQPLESDPCETPTAWINRVIGLLDHASRQLGRCSESAQFALIQATALLKQQVCPEVQTIEIKVRRGLLAWQVRKIREFVDKRLSSRLLVSDLSSVVEMSEAHFSRLFKQAVGESPHAFILRRRLELAGSTHAGERCPIERHRPAVRFHWIRPTSASSFDRRSRRARRLLAPIPNMRNTAPESISRARPHAGDRAEGGIWREVQHDATVTKVTVR